MIGIVRKIAEKAGEELLRYYGKVQERAKDENNDPASVVSEADEAAEHIILEDLRREFPKHNMFSEEAGWIKNGSEFTWYIDPLDGTSNFVRNIPLFGVSIGLARENRPILGLLHFPLLNVTVWAKEGGGAFCNGEMISVSSRSMNQALYFSRGVYGGELALNENIALAAGATKIFDSSAYELAQIACGNGEIYALNNVPHDVVAGAVIVREAGGRVTDFSGEEWTVDSGTILATNGAAHNEALATLKQKNTRREAG